MRLICIPYWEMSMVTFDSIPQARVVRKGSQLYAPPPAPRVRREPGPIVQQLHTALAVAIGMWPLTAVMLLAMGFLIMAARAGSP